MAHTKESLAKLSHTYHNARNKFESVAYDWYNNEASEAAYDEAKAVKLAAEIALNTAWAEYEIDNPPHYF